MALVSEAAGLDRSSEDRSLPAPEPRFRSSPPPGETCGGDSSGGTSRGTGRGRSRLPTHTHSPNPSLQPSFAVDEVCSEFTAAQGLMNYVRAPDPSVSTLSERNQRPRRLADSSLCAEKQRRGFQGPPRGRRVSPLPVLAEPWALCSPPLSSAPSLCFSARRRSDKCL